MSNALQGLLGVNWKTTFAGITVILALVGKIIAEAKAKDLVTALTDVQSLIGDVIALAIGIGLIKSKDGDTTGNGTNATKAGS